jgi:hypothetical protein
MRDLPPDRMKALGRAARAFLIEAAIEVVKKIFPWFGPIEAAWEAYRDALRPKDPHGQVLEMLQNRLRDYQRLLEPELRAQAGDTVAIALREAIGILDKHQLSLRELVTEAGLDSKRAARLTMRRADDQARRLEEPAWNLVGRMVEDYYRLLLEHPKVRDDLNMEVVRVLRDLIREVRDDWTREMI